MTTKKTRKTHTSEFKAEALKLAERVGVKFKTKFKRLNSSQPLTAITSFQLY